MRLIYCLYAAVIGLIISLQLIVGLVVAFTYWLQFPRFLQHKPSRYLTLALFASLGFLWGQHALLYAKHTIASLPHKAIPIQLHILRITKQTPLMTQISAQVSDPQLPHILTLSWYHPHTQVTAGQTWQGYVKVKASHHLMNTYAEVLTMSHNYSVTGYLQNHPTPQLISNQPTWIQRTHNRFHQWIQHSKTSQDTKAIFSALLLGDRSLWTPPIRFLLQNTGTTHLFAISGLHVGLVAGSIFLILYTLCRYIPFTLRTNHCREAALVISLCLGWLYGALTGWAPSTERALIMISLYVIYQCIHIRASPMQILSSSVALLLCANPLLFYNIGFQFSVIAVGIICFHYQKYAHHPPRHWKERCIRALGLQSSIIMGLWPLSLFYFHQITWLAWPANLIAIPVVSWILLPCLLIAALIHPICYTLSHLLLHIADGTWHWLYLYLHTLTQCPHHTFWADPPPAILISTTIGLFTILSMEHLSLKLIGLLYCVPVCFSAAHSPPLHSVHITVWSVGQGLGVTVQTHTHTLVYDTGPHYPFGFDAGRDVLLGGLHRQSTQQINTLMISHGDNDHSGGAHSLITHIRTEHLLTSDPDFFLIKNANFCYNGQHWSWDGVRFSVLAPLPNQPYSGNNSSCVLKIQAGHNSILLTGDIEKKEETRLVTHAPQQLPADILLAPHHGSATSSSPAFLDAVHPKFAIYSTGYLNRFHFPAKSVTSRYTGRHIKTWNTAIDGAINILMTPDHISITPTNKHNKHITFRTRAH